MANTSSSAVAPPAGTASRFRNTAPNKALRCQTNPAPARWVRTVTGSPSKGEVVMTRRRHQQAADGKQRRACTEQGTGPDNSQYPAQGGSSSSHDGLHAAERKAMTLGNMTFDSSVGISACKAGT